MADGSVSLTEAVMTVQLSDTASEGCPAGCAVEDHPDLGCSHQPRSGEAPAPEAASAGTPCPRQQRGEAPRQREHAWRPVLCRVLSGGGVSGASGRRQLGQRAVSGAVATQRRALPNRAADERLGGQPTGGERAPSMLLDWCSRPGSRSIFPKRLVRAGGFTSAVELGMRWQPVLRQKALILGFKP